MENRPGFLQVSSADKEVSFGTMMYNNNIGEVTSLSHARTANEISVTGGMNQELAHIYTGFRHELNMTVLIMGDAPLPGPGDEVEYPGQSFKGRITGAVTKTADPSGAHSCSFTVTSWDSFDNSGAGSAFVTDASGTPIPQA